MVPDNSKRTYNITSLQRGLRLLQLFSSAEHGLAATQVAKLSGLPVSTVHRFLMNLESAGFLNCALNGTYRLGMACFSVGQAALSQLDIRRRSLPYLQELNRQTRETVHLTVRHGLSAVYVDKLDSPEPLRIFSRIGAAVPLYCTAVGKVLLAYLPEPEQVQALRQLELRRHTPNTVGNLQELKAQLLKVRKNGFAWDLEEHELHIRCLAAPIHDHTGAVNASLSITAPLVRLSITRLRQLAPLVQEAGRKISGELGYVEPRKPVNTAVAGLRISAPKTVLEPVSS
jgi:IclR family transcriptional regulator, KDG regulon repressor